MKSICIKTNNINSLKYLLYLLDNSHIKNICYSYKKYKYYKNIIIHCTDKNSIDYIPDISKILSLLIIEKYEDLIFKRLIVTNYFYFDSQERKAIFKIARKLLLDNETLYLENRQKILCQEIYKYLSENKSIVLEGFINFRIKKYLELINTVIDDAVNQYIVEKEYWEFISLLKVYINSEVSSIDQVHLIYNDSEALLLDNDNNAIKIDTDAFKTKYLSDITFSTNDYILNTLLNLVPKKINIYLSSESPDEFINTLQLVFEDRVKIYDNRKI